MIKWRVGESVKKKENMMNNWISQPDFGVMDGDINASWEGGQSAWRRLAFQSPVLLLPVISLSFSERKPDQKAILSIFLVVL